MLLQAIANTVTIKDVPATLIVVAILSLTAFVASYFDLPLPHLLSGVTRNIIGRYPAEP